MKGEAQQLLRQLEIALHLERQLQELTVHKDQIIPELQHKITHLIDTLLLVITLLVEVTHLNLLELLIVVQIQGHTHLQEAVADQVQIVHILLLNHRGVLALQDHHIAAPDHQVAVLQAEAAHLQGLHHQQVLVEDSKIKSTAQSL